ncbi:MAG: nucleotide sugar dehydrogenase [Wenyingzhuangia sp.]|uniref:nucleotide sugar dehydrogenase n=1 Tax=Wenyingzhuangia sp. TaxID=1964193 RepID=UPI00321B31B6
MKIAIIGLGYVGLPLARLFSEKYATVGFDVSENRISDLKKGVDSTLEITEEELNKVLVSSIHTTRGLFCTSDVEDLSTCNFYIVTVPTPVDKNNRPVLTPLIKASETIGSVLKKGDVVVYESTVYPGATEGDCVPVLENRSGLIFNQDFFVGYSPERINPGDKLHTVDKIMKVVSGSTQEVGVKIDQVYKSVITAGTHLAPSIKVAEAAKVIENSQRDINIAFVNELSKIFNLMDIDTGDVLKAARTKWNFMPFKPGLVGGHCIGVDPYYLAQKAQEFGYLPEIILAGRRMNDSMGSYVASQVAKLMIQRDTKIKGAKVLVLGFTFKEDCPDVRNTKVIDVVRELQDFGVCVDVFDPLANPIEVQREYNINLLKQIPSYEFEAVILAVPHRELLSIDIKELLLEEGVFYDVKGVASSLIADGKL